MLKYPVWGRQDILRQDILRQDILRQYILRQYILRQYILRQGILRQYILRQDILRQDILRQDIIRTAFLKTVKQPKQSLLGLLEPEEDITFLRNAGTYLPIDTAQCPRRLASYEIY